MKHNLHQQVGLKLSKLNSEKVRVILDSACINESEDVEIHNISLFLDKKSSETVLCNVDALIIKEGKVCVIIEIDESKTNPTQICGKYLTSALSNLYQYDKDTIEISDATVLFVQIIDSTKFPYKSKKLNKLEIIRKKINENPQGIVKKYCLFTDKEIDKAFVEIRDYLNYNTIKNKSIAVLSNFDNLSTILADTQQAYWLNGGSKPAERSYEIGSYCPTGTLVEAATSPICQTLGGNYPADH